METHAARVEEIPFTVARVILQDFTGVPLLADLAMMRSAAQTLGKNPKKIELLVPVDMVVASPDPVRSSVATTRSI